MPQEREVTRIYKWKPLASRPIGRRHTKGSADNEDRELEEECIG
jgi:hypothetical protein